MSQWKRNLRRNALLAVFTASLFVVNSPHVSGQFFRERSVGGISIDAHGVVSQADAKSTRLFRDEMLRTVRAADSELAKLIPMRKISLRNLQSEIDLALAENGELPEEIEYLAGIQRLEYILVYPEHNDIVLAGPGEGWTVNPKGNVVGVTTGLPVIKLDDLLVAFRSVSAAKSGGISCSIDPTTEGLKRLQDYLSKQGKFRRSVVSKIKKVLGPQTVTIHGVNEDTHFARVLAAADYRMKRIAMNLEPSPVPELPGFLDLLKSRPGGLSSATPRWWLACDYQPLAQSEDGLAWQLRGQGVKAMTENDIVNAHGERARDHADPIAQEWADMMTANYDQLSRREAVFGQLRNLMDLCVVAALIEKEGMRETASCDLSLLMGSESPLATQSWNTARTVNTESSFVKKGNEYIITASGGVDIDSWSVVSKSEVDEHVNHARQQAARPADRKGWWWN